MKVKEYFDNAAGTWDERFSTPALFSFLEIYLPKFGLKAGQNVVDVGTGTGVLIPYLIRAIGSSGSVTAIDCSEKMVEACKARHSHFKNVTIKVGNIEEDSLPSESIDTVTCFGVFPHLLNKHKALRNINNMLKPLGKLIIFHALSSEELKSHHKRVSEHVAQAVIPKKTEMFQYLERAGFTNISIKDEPGCYLCISYKA